MSKNEIDQKPRRADDRGHISMRKDTYEKLQRHAKAKNRSVSSILEEWVDEVLNKAGAP